MSTVTGSHAYLNKLANKKKMALECNTTWAAEQVIAIPTIITIRKRVRDPPRPVATDTTHLAATPWFYPFVP